MTATERNELIRSLIYDYWANKVNDKVWEREKSSLYYMSLGKLLGALMAFRLDMEEDEKGITIRTQDSNRTVLRYEF